MDNGLPVQCLSERDFLFPDADEKYVPEVLAYIQSTDFGTFTSGPSALRKGGGVCRRTPWEWMARQRLNGYDGDDTPGTFDT